MGNVVHAWPTCACMQLSANITLVDKGAYQAERLSHLPACRYASPKGFGSNLLMYREVVLQISKICMLASLVKNRY